MMFNKVDEFREENEHLKAERDRLRSEKTDLRQERDRLTKENTQLLERLRGTWSIGGHDADKERTQRLAQENAGLREDQGRLEQDLKETRDESKNVMERRDQLFQEKEQLERDRQYAHNEAKTLRQDRDKWKNEALKGGANPKADPSEGETADSIRQRGQRCAEIANDYSRAYLRLREKANEWDTLKDEPKGKNSFITFTQNFGSKDAPNRYTYVAVKVDDTPGKGWYVTGRTSGPLTWQGLKSKMEDGKFDELTPKDPTSDAQWSVAYRNAVSPGVNWFFRFTNAFA